MKPLRHLLLAALLAVGARAAAYDYAYLLVSAADGTTTFTVSQISQITFDQQYMTVSLTDGTQQRLPLATLDRMAFATSQTEGIGEARSDGFTIDGDVLRVNTTNGAQVTLYNLNGQVVRQFTTHESKAELNISGLRQGAYIVKVNGETRKFLHK